MGRKTEVELTAGQREKLEGWVRSGKTEQRLARRARIVLAAAEGRATTEIAKEMGLWPYQVSKWRARFSKEGLEGLFDRPRSGKPAVYDGRTDERVLKVLDDRPPEGRAGWTAALVSERLGDVGERQVWRILQRHGIHLQRRRTWCVSTDPEFAAKAADVVGLYLNPPDNAVVLCVDEKPHIQALERAQGWLRLPNGRAVTGESHRYKRHGTTTLFAALEVATGLVKAGHFNRRRRCDFLAFMNELVLDRPDRQLHVILDNLNIHKPKNDRWLARHRNVHFHFVPTNASWLNQIEIWFSILSRRALKGASFTSAAQLRLAIDNFIRHHNERAAPFQWKKTVVKQSNPEKHYSKLRR